MHGGQEDPFDYEPCRQILLATWPKSVGSGCGGRLHLVFDITPDCICRRHGTHFLYQSVLRCYPLDFLSV